MSKRETMVSGPGVDLLAGSGEVRALMRARDWDATPIGSPVQWPSTLRALVGVMLTSRFAMWMAWGPELTFLCNDAYLPTVGVKRDWVIGSRSDKVWAEIWPDIGPRIAHVLSTGEATWDEALLLYLERRGFAEETYHTFSYSPLADDAGRNAGMLCVVAEVTERVIGERQLATLRDLGSRLAAASTRAEVMASVEICLAEEPRDLPFALAYLAESGGKEAALTAAHGLNRNALGAPEVVPLDGRDPFWPLDVAAAGPALVSVPREAVANLRLDHWQQPPNQALIAPIVSAQAVRPSDFLSRVSIRTAPPTPTTAALWNCLPGRFRLPLSGPTTSSGRGREWRLWPKSTAPRRHFSPTSATNFARPLR
jgi:hypothetical protein